ncbi:MAG: ATP-binding protein [Lepagella sp.]
MSTYIPRLISSKIEDLAQYFPVIVITGPRQSGKTSLCRNLYPDYNYVNLEYITTRKAALLDPTNFIESLGERVIIDEVQHAPELLSIIQVKVDNNRKLRYILTGSSNFSLMKTVSQSLAGRVALFTLLPLSLSEIQNNCRELTIETIMRQGQFPGVIAEGVPSYQFYRNYYNTYVERDLRELLRLKNILSFDTFIRLLASRVGSEYNASSIAREVGVSSNTITEWLSILATSYIAFPHRPYYNNISKRLTKIPKIYFYDTGLLCYLLEIQKDEQLLNHPLRGAIFENLSISELYKRQYNQALEPNLYFYREHSGKEIDGVLVRPDGIDLYEMKVGKTFRPEFADNMKALAVTFNNIRQTTVIYDGESIPPICINIRDLGNFI